MWRPSSILFVATLACLNAAKASAVLDLIPDNFDDIVVKSGKPALVEFFAPWCGHCKSLAPIYEELGQVFEPFKEKVTIAKVDADAQRELGTRFSIQGFPTLKWFDGKSDKPEDYNGGRDLESLKAFIEEKTGIKGKGKKPPKSDVEMLNDATFGKTVGSNKGVLVAFTAPWCGHCKSLAPIWENLAATFSADKSSVTIAKVDAEAANSKQIAQDQGVKSYPTIKYFAAGSSEPEEYKGGRSEADFVNFINDKIGTHRVPGGGLDATAGTIAALDTLVARFTGKQATLSEVSVELSKAATGLQDVYAKYYVKVAEKLGANEGYVEKELKRLTGMLQKGGMAPQKTDDVVMRSNILSRFKQTVMGEHSEEVKDEL